MSRFSLLLGHDAAVAAFVGERLGPPFDARGFGPSVGIGVIDADGCLVAGMVYHNWQPEAGIIEMSGAAVTPRWLTPRVLHAIFAYPFDQLGCQLVVMRVSEHDTRLARILTAFGFSSHRIERLRGRDEAEIIYTLTDDAWRAGRFYRRQHGQAEPSRADAA